MSFDDPEPRAIHIVRTYSDKVADRETPRNGLETALVTWGNGQGGQEVQDDAWRRWLEFEQVSDDVVTSDLELQCKEVAKVWNKFKSDFPEAEIQQVGPPSIETLQVAVSSAQTRWQGRREVGFGRIKAKLMAFFDVMDDHSTLFNVIPSGDKYLCLFTGVISSIVQASVNHETVADGISSALVNISKDMQFVRECTLITSSLTVKQAVVRLYVEVFSFLCYCMKWYQSSWIRFKKSFDKNFYDKHVEKRIDDIKVLVKQVSREAKLQTQKKTASTEERTTRMERELLGLKDLTNELLRKTGDQTRNASLEDQNKLLQHFSSELGEKLQKNLIEGLKLIAVQDILQLKSTATAYILSNSYDPPGKQELQGITHSSILAMSREGLQGFAGAINQYADDAKAELLPRIYREGKPVLPRNVFMGIQSWIDEPSSKFIWIEGPAFSSVGSQLSMMVLRLSLEAMNAGIPSISFFAKRRYETRQPNTRQREAGLVALAYTLIDQLIQLTPIEFEPPPSLSEEKFQRLDGTIESYSGALDIIAALLALAPPSVICVIDALENIDHRDTVTALTELIEILREAGKTKTIKVLVSTSGNCRALLKTTRVRERLSAERMAIARGSSPLPGAIDIGDLCIKALNNSDSLDA
ncbi:hypothetical protein F5Y15DRAFT_151514 [Xylariaceae sp. FL0016]|nr:hypothetical protein F5Y15DRAFT_151514 [Xylariaceae sp. FL0016]